MDKVVLERIQRGEIPELTEATLEEELRGLREDLVNWDHGHPMDLMK